MAKGEGNGDSGIVAAKVTSNKKDTRLRELHHDRNDFRLG